MARATCDKVGSDIRRINDFVRGECSRQNISQQALAEYIGITRVTLGRILKGDAEWKLKDLLNALEYLGADLGTITERREQWTD